MGADGMRVHRWQQVGQLGQVLAALAGALMLVLAVSIADAGVAWAHAAYVSSIPAPGAVLPAAPSTITIHFAEHVNPTGSDIVVLDAKGKTVSTGPAQVVRTDLKTMTVAMQGDDSEIYLVQWHTVSADDSDPDIGAFTFTVSTSAPPQPTTTATPPPPCSGTGTCSGTAGIPGWVVVLGGVLALLVGAAGGVVLWRRMAR
jgi:copper resistance protein C